MRLTKYQHACFTVEENNQLVVVDPGFFTTDFIAPERIVAVVITHSHDDHLDKDYLAEIATKNPEVTIVAHPSITSQIESIKTQEVLAGDTCEIGNFSLKFFGGDHAIIHNDIQAPPNLGVLINDLIYYPGDSFVRPEVSVDTLALPVSAPWMKISEAVDFLRDVQPRFAFPTHDAILSLFGKSIPDKMIPDLVKTTEYRRIDGETIEV